MPQVHSSSKTLSTKAERRERGFTLLELTISCAILVILATAALPLERVALIHRKEELLRYNLREIRDAIDAYHDDAEKGKFQVQAGTENYPPDLQTLVDGVKLAAAGQNGQTQKVRYLRKIPVDPMTSDTDWGLRSVQDDVDSTSWGGQDVFDVYSKSQGTAMDGTKYADW